MGRGLLLVLSLTLLGVSGFCPGQNFLDIPLDPTARGPWPVGVKTVRLSERNLTTEIWYPAFVGSERGREKVQYSVRDEHLPPRQANKIPDDENPIQFCDCYRDLPIDALRGPYPVHIHIHGTAAFRHASLEQMTHYASRGFIVVACDHPGITLYDLLDLRPGGPQTDQTGDARLLISELNSLLDPQLGFLKGHLDMTRLAMSGHSAGGSAIRGLGDVAQVLMSWTSGAIQEGSALKSTLILGAEFDNYQGRLRSYENSPSPKRFIGIERAGHVAPTSLCRIGEEDGGIVEIALRNGLYLAYLLQPLIGPSCDEGSVYNEAAWDLVDYSTVGVQEEVLMCRPEMKDILDRLSSRANVLDYLSDL